MPRKKLYLHFINEVNGNVNYRFDSKRSFPLNSWIAVKVTQLHIKGKLFRYTIHINGRRVFTVINRKAKNFRKVKVYVSDPWYPAAKGVIRGLVFKAIPVKTSVSRGMYC